MNSFGNIPDLISNSVLMAEAMTEMLVNSALETGQGATSGGSNIRPPGDDEGLSNDEKVEAAKSKCTTQKIAQMLAPFQTLAVVGINKGIENSHAKDAAAEKASGGFDKPWLDMAGKAATGFCSGLGGGFTNENLRRGSVLRDYVLRAFPQSK
jgi:hypothetical protein